MSKPQLPANYQKFSYWLLSIAILSSFSNWGQVLPVLAASPAPGTVIENQATGSYIDPTDNSEKEIESNTVKVTVAEVAGITVVGSGITEAPSSVSGAGTYQGNGSINTGDIVYFQYTITNVGNDPTQFFIPGSPSSITGGTLQSSIQIIEYDPDGSSGATAPTDLSASPVDIPSTGTTTGTALGLPNGSLPAGGTVKIRVPIQITANSSTTVQVIMGDTASNDNSTNTQNQAYSANSSNLDLYTQDNQDTDGIANEANGNPVNGDATNHRQEASYSQSTSVKGIDAGDAPNDLTSIDASLTNIYPSASHTIDGLTYLGDRVDEEAAGQATVNADGDDTNGTPNDEDGVTFPLTGTTRVLYSGQSNSLTIKASQAGVLNAWIDWNQDGDWSDSGEQIATNVSLTTGNNTLLVTVPDTAPHGATYTRFRFSTQTNLTPTGLASDGEVEDYKVNLALPAPVACSSGLLNGGFELPVIGSPSPTSLEDFGFGGIMSYKEADVSWWGTIPNSPSSGSDFDNRNAIELWKRGNTIQGTPFFGDQFAEINAYVPGRLYQDLAVPPGTQIRWQVAHRGRAGNDTLGVYLGVPGSELSQGSYTTPNTEWRVYSGLYTVPSGQYLTRFALKAESATGGISVGNFVDDVRLSNFCAPTVQGFKSVKLTTDADSNNQVSPGDTLTYTLYYVNVANSSTGPAANFQINDPLPAGLTITATGGQTVTASGAATSANKNSSYTGASTGAVSNLLNSGALLDVGGTIKIEIPVTVNASASGILLNQGTSSATEFSGNNVNTDNVDSTTSGLPSSVIVPSNSVVQQQNATVDPTTFSIATANNPNLLLVKRITAINGQNTNPNDNTDLNVYVNDSSNIYDDNTDDTPASGQPEDTTYWQDPSQFLKGAIDGGKVKPDDEIEYTIYFLSAGTSTSQNVLVCDLVPEHLTFIPDAFATNKGISWLKNGTTASLTNANDADSAYYFAAGVEPSTVFSNVKCGNPNNPSANTNGAVVVNLGDVDKAIAPGDPTDSYGWIRFRAKVK